MANDVTVLRFYKEGQPAPKLGVDRFHDLTRELANFAVIVSGNVGVHMPAWPLDIVGSPRVGCLEVLISPAAVDASYVHDLANLMGVSVGAVFEFLKEWSGLGGFLWTVIYGGQGVFDRLRRHEPPPAIDVAQDIDMSVALEAVLAQAVERGVAAAMRTGPPNYANVERAAAATNMTRVTIETREGVEVTLWQFGESTRAGIIGSKSPGFEGDLPGGNRVTLSRTDIPGVDVVYQGRRFPTWVAQSEAGAVLVLWEFEEEPPAFGSSIEAYGTWLSLGEVAPVAPLEDNHPLESTVSHGFLVTSIWATRRPKLRQL